MAADDRSDVKEDGIVYPRQVASPPGLPEGWVTIERVNLSGNREGQTYIRYETREGRHTYTSSIKQAIVLDCQDRGENPDKKIQEHKDMVEAEKKRKQKANGTLKGDDLTQAIKAYRDKFGPMDGPTMAKLCQNHGWAFTGRVGGDGQLTMAYFNTSGTRMGLFKEVECHLGAMLQDGESLQYIQDAKDEAKAEWGDYDKGFNPLRRGAVEVGEEKSNGPVNGRASPGSHKRRKLNVSDSDYHESSALAVGIVPVSEGKQAAVDFLKKCKPSGTARPEVESLGSTCHRVYECLMQRRFSKDVEVVAVCSRDTPSAASASNIQRVCGVYYQKQGLYDGHSVYQKVDVSSAASGLSCSPVSLFWSGSRSAWKIGILNDSEAGFALRPGVEMPTLISKTPWMLLKDEVSDAKS